VSKRREAGKKGRVHRRGKCKKVRVAIRGMRNNGAAKGGADMEGAKEREKKGINKAYTMP
jgi:hypothetical protein